VELLFNKPLDALSHSVFIKGRVKVGTELIFGEGFDSPCGEIGTPTAQGVVQFSYTMGSIFDLEDLGPDIGIRIGHFPFPPFFSLRGGITWRIEVDFNLLWPT